MVLFLQRDQLFLQFPQFMEMVAAELGAVTLLFSGDSISLENFHLVGKIRIQVVMRFI